jgi:hypothetical protein
MHVHNDPNKLRLYIIRKLTCMFFPNFFHFNLLSITRHIVGRIMIKLFSNVIGMFFKNLLVTRKCLDSYTLQN